MFPIKDFFKPTLTRAASLFRAIWRAALLMMVWLDRSRWHEQEWCRKTAKYSVSSLFAPHVCISTCCTRKAYPSWRSDVRFCLLIAYPTRKSYHGIWRRSQVERRDRWSLSRLQASRPTMSDRRIQGDLPNGWAPVPLSNPWFVLILCGRKWR